MKNPNQLGNPKWPNLFGFNLLLINSSSLFPWSKWLECFLFYCGFFFRIIKWEHSLCYFLGPLLPSLDIPWLPSKCSPPPPSPQAQSNPGPGGFEEPCSHLWMLASYCTRSWTKPNSQPWVLFLCYLLPHSLSICPGNLPDTLAPPRQDLASLSPEYFLWLHSVPPLFLSLSPWSLTQTLPWLTDVPVTAWRLSGFLITSHHVPPSSQSVIANLGAPTLKACMDYKSMSLSPWQQALACPSDFFSDLQYGPSTLPSLSLLSYTYPVPVWQTSFPVPPYSIQFPIASVLLCLQSWAVSK